MDLKPGQRLDGYTITRRLGQGGAGTVWQARDPGGHLVVLKVPFTEALDDTSEKARHERELEILRALDHPYIQRLVATGRTASGVPFTVLEWVDGGLLRDHLYEGTPLPIEDAVRLAIQLCDALQYCHERGIVHRDLKPENVLVTTSGDVKLMDFGAAVLANRPGPPGLTPALGTPDYMSPEQALGFPGDARSDVYALGVLLYELLAGAAPFSGDNALAVMAQHVQRKPPPLREQNQRVPPALEAAVMKALRKDPVARFPSMAALRRALALSFP